MKNKEVTGMHLKKHIVFLIIVILYLVTSGLAFIIYRCFCRYVPFLGVLI